MTIFGSFLAPSNPLTRDVEAEAEGEAEAEAKRKQCLKDGSGDGSGSERSKMEAIKNLELPRLWYTRSSFVHS